MKNLLTIVFCLSIAFFASAQNQLKVNPNFSFDLASPGVKNDFDAIKLRHQLSQSLNRGGNEVEILIDYADSNGDDIFLIQNINMNYTLPPDTEITYVVVGFDTLHDVVTDIGYAYSDFDSVRVDTLYFLFGHENNSNTTDSIVIKVIQLNANGYPTTTELWSDFFTSSSSFTGLPNWTNIILAEVPVGLVLPPNTRFGLKIEYYGAKEDTFGIVYSFVDKGPCPVLNAPYSAELSGFWPNSYRFDLFNSMLLPTATGQDVFLDCDNNGTPETPWFMQNINFYTQVTGFLAGGGPGPQGCDTLSNVLPTHQIGLYPTQNGYVSGNNEFGDLAKADFFANSTPGGTVEGAIFFFGAASAGSPTSTVQAAVWNSNGPGGSPGTLLTSQDILISSIIQDVTLGFPTIVNFTQPAAVNGNFYVGIILSNAPGDTVALLTNTIGNNTPTAWERWDTGNWYAYNNVPSWELDIAHVILPFLCFPDPCPAISVSVSETPADCANANGTATAVATGGDTPYSYLWSNGQTDSIATGLSPLTYTVTATDNEGCTATGSVTVTNNIISLNVNFSTTDNSSCSAPNGDATATAVGGTAPYTYVWSNGGITDLISGLTGGTYFVTAFDANGCEGIDSVVVSNNLPLISINVVSTTPNTSCSSPNGTAEVAAAGGAPGYTYLWDAAANNQTDATAINLNSGTFSVTATDTEGCQGVESVVISDNTPVITITVDAASPSTSCAAPDGSGTVSATGGTAPYSFEWSDGQTGENATGLAGGNYTVTATDADGCTASTTVNITSTTAVITVSITGLDDNTSCVSANGSVSVSAAGGSSPYTYLWNTGSTDDAISGLAGGTYSVSATDDNSCTGTTSINLNNNLPVVVLNAVSGDVTSCSSPNGTALVTASGGTTYTYAWSNGGSAADIDNLSAGSYSVTVTDDASGCADSASVTVGSSLPVVSASITVNSDITSCATPNGALTASATGGTVPYDYAWSNSATTASISGLSVGSYAVTATDSDGCSGTATAPIVDASGTVNVVVNATDVTTCVSPNGTVTASATGGATPYTYSWTGGETSAALNNLNAGNYSVTVTDANGCQGTGSETVGSNLNLPTISLTATNETSNGAGDGTVTSTVSGGNAPYSFSWSNGSTTASLSGLGPGNYAVTVTDANGCAATASATVGTDVSVALPSIITSLSIFPNPTNDVVFVKIDMHEIHPVRIQWFNVLGELVFNREINQASAINERFDLSSLSEGIYMTRIMIGDEQIIKRVSVVR